jgi:hypothetical protein
MDIDPIQLQEMIDSGKPEQIRAAQTELQRKGLYDGSIDGSLGKKPKESGTVKALNQYKLQYTRQLEQRANQQEAEAQARTDRLREQELANQRLQLEQQGKKGDAETEALQIDTARKKQYQEDAGSGWGITSNIAAHSLAPAAGYLGGRKLGALANREANVSQTSRNQVLQGVADDRMAGRTTTKGARTGAERSGAMPSRNSALRVFGRQLPHTIGGGAMLGKGALLAFGDEGGDSYYADQANQALGWGMMGAGTGILEKGGSYAVNPGVAPDAKSIAIIESDQLRRGPAQPAASKTIEGTLAKTLSDPQPTALSPGTKAYMYQQAKDLKIPGRSKMTKSDLAIALADANIEHGGKRTIASRVKKLPKVGVAGPLVAGLVGYDLATGDAQAADGSTVGALDETARGLTGGAMGVTGYAGGRKLANTLANYAPTAMKAMGGGMQMMMPTAAAEMTDYTPEETNMARNWTARNMPEVSQFVGGYPKEAYDMAQMPPPNPARGQIPRDPQSIPQNDPSEVQMLINEGVPPELIASYLNHIAAQQGAM